MWIGAVESNDPASRSVPKNKVAFSHGFAIDTGADLPGCHVSENHNMAPLVGRRLGSGLLLALGIAGWSALLGSARGDDADPAATAAQVRAFTMQRFVVADTRLDKKPWRYATVDGFEVLSRASDDDTAWLLDSLRRGQAIERRILPPEWLPEPAVPDTVIIDDTDLNAMPDPGTHSQQLAFARPGDAFTWGRFSPKVLGWNDRFEAHDQDTYALNVDLFGVDMKSPACAVGLGKVFRCAPPLPEWLLEGLVGSRCGIFRESFMPTIDVHKDGWIQSAEGPGTLWVSAEETQRLLKEIKVDPKGRRTKIAVPPLQEFFSGAPVTAEDRQRWESEAGLLARWGLLGPGREDPATVRGFLELVQRARREPVSERVFTECFGFGYAVMEKKLAAYLRIALAQPTSIELRIPLGFPEPELQKATADQIGRILADWLRMGGDSLRVENPGLAGVFLNSAGRMLERAYRDDNGLPPDENPLPGTQPSVRQAKGVPGDSAVVMKPFAVSSSRIHDPRLLSVYGMFEHDIGDDGRAFELLEAAARGGVVRPKASIALAELRYTRAIANPVGSAGKLSLEQARSVLGALDDALRYRQSPDPYTLTVETWERCDGKPTPPDVARMLQGVRNFPRYTSLAYHAASVCGLSGYRGEAEEMLRLGLLFTNSERARQSFVLLHSRITAQPAIQVE